MLVAIDAFGTVPKSLERKLEMRKNRSHIDTGIVEISKNTRKSPGDLKRIAVTQIPVKDNRL